MDTERNADAAPEEGEAGRVDEIREFVERLLEAGRFDLEAKVHVERDALVIQLQGADNAILLDHRAETLEAFQALLGKILPRRYGTTLRILVDCANYRVGREHELIEIARRSAERVLKLKQPIELSPMNPQERRIVHLAVAEIEGVQTASSGDGVMKRVSIVPSPNSGK